MTGSPRTHPRPSAAKMLTLCPDCGYEVGAVMDRFNRNALDAQWRRSRHFRDGKLCTGARNVISENVIWEAPHVAAVVG